MSAAAAWAGARAARRRTSVSEARQRGALERQQQQLRAEAASQAEAARHAARQDPAAFLEGLGLRGSSQRASDGGGAALRIQVHGHQEEQRCTYYQMRCTLTRPEHEEPLSWHCKSRLVDLREQLYELVQEDMGSEYEAAFEDAPFALRGGLPGTTARLRKWLEALARCISAGQLSPMTCASALCFLGVPTEAAN